MCFNPVEEVFGENGFLTAVTIQKPDVDFFNLSTRQPYLHGNISVKFYEVISNIFKNMSFLAHSAWEALLIVYESMNVPMKIQGPEILTGQSAGNLYICGTLKPCCFNRRLGQLRWKINLKKRRKKTISNSSIWSIKSSQCPIIDALRLQMPNS